MRVDFLCEVNYNRSMKDISQNQKATLTFKLDDNTRKEVNCIIKEVQNDRISLVFPEDMMVYADYFSESAEMPVKIYTPSGLKTFETIIINSPLEDDFVIEFSEDIVDIQRRAYPRASLDTKIIIERNERDNIVTKTLDIGGGGIRFSCNGNLYPNEEIGILLYLPFHIHSTKAKGIILQKEYLPNDECVLVFTKIADQDRNKIIKNCTENRTKLLNQALQDFKQ